MPFYRKRIRISSKVERSVRAAMNLRRFELDKIFSNLTDPFDDGDRTEIEHDQGSNVSVMIKPSFDEPENLKLDRYEFDTNTCKLILLDKVSKIHLLISKEDILGICNKVY